MELKNFYCTNPGMEVLQYYAHLIVGMLHYTCYYTNHLSQVLRVSSFVKADLFRVSMAFVYTLTTN